MTEVFSLLAGLAIGGAVGVWIGLLRGRGATAAMARESAGFEATVEALRAQLASREAELSELRRALSEQERSATESKARLESAREHFAEQRRQIEEMEKKVKDAFAALSSAALKSSNEQFLTLADEKMKPLREQLERYEKQVKELEKSRSEAYGGMTKHLQRIEEGREQLSRETQQLVAALRQPGVKGRWGEVTLRNVVEMTGMSKHCDFVEQASVAGADGGRLRPDLVVRLPGGRSIVIDSKVNASAYLDAVQSPDEAVRKRQMSKYAADVRGTLRALSAKEYWRNLSPTPEFVVMFMPGEAFFAAAVAEDSDLLREGIDGGVLLASPTTLSALLMAIRYGWQQQVVAENAEKIADAGRELHDRLCKFADHLDRIRVGIEGAAKAYDQAVGNWESRTLPSARKLKELDAAAAGKEMTDLRRVEATMRPASLEGVEEDHPAGAA